MKLLLLDYISFKGHQNFNKIHIDALLALGHELILVGRKGQFDNIETSVNVCKLEIPEVLFKEYPVPAISFRLQGMSALFWIKKHIRESDYDAVIILTYDILSLFMFRIKQKTFLINHNNVPQLWSKVKLFFTRRLPKNYIHIALNKEMEGRLKELLPDREIYHVPHGICPPSKTVKMPTFVKVDERYLLCPVNNNYDATFVKRVFEDQRFYQYMCSHNITLFVKDSIGVKCDKAVIKSIPSTLEKDEYNYLLDNAMAVILPYGEGFKYRCSGIFFECIARSIPVITTQLDAFKIYKENVDMGMFVDVDSLIDAVDYYLHNTYRKCNMQIFSPYKYWADIFKNIK